MILGIPDPQESDFKKVSHHRSFLIEKTLNDDFESKDPLFDEGLLESLTHETRGASKNGGREFFDYKELYLGAEKQVDELRRLHKLEL